MSCSPQMNDVVLPTRTAFQCAPIVSRLYDGRVDNGSSASSSPTDRSTVIIRPRLFILARRGDTELVALSEWQTNQAEITNSVRGETFSVNSNVADSLSRLGRESGDIAKSNLASNGVKTLTEGELLVSPRRTRAIVEFELETPSTLGSYVDRARPDQRRNAPFERRSDRGTY